MCGHESPRPVDGSGCASYTSRQSLRSGTDGTPRKGIADCMYVAMPGARSGSAASASLRRTSSARSGIVSTVSALHHHQEGA